MWAALLPLVLWLAAIAACVYEDDMNLFRWMGCFSQALEHPFSVRWTAHTLKFMLGSVFLYGCGIALYYSGRENRRPGEEYGSAKWGDPKELNRKYMDHQHIHKPQDAPNYALPDLPYEFKSLDDYEFINMEESEHEETEKEDDAES